MNEKINAALLYFFLLPKSMYVRQGVHMPHLQAILRAKLKMDDRRPGGWSAIRHQQDKKEINTATLVTMGLALLMGLTFTIVLLIRDDLLRLTLYFTLFGFMLSTFLIMDFGQILIDTRDNDILLPKPVKSETFVAARLIHILIHVTKVVVPLSFFGCVAMLVKTGMWGTIVFILTIALLTMLTFALVNATYLVIIRLFSVERLNSILTSFQIIFAILTYGAYQFLPRLVDLRSLEDLDLLEKKWIWAFPSFWLAAAWKLLYTFSPEVPLLIGGLLSVLIPVLAIWMVIRYLAPVFLSKLSMMSAGIGSHTGSRRRDRVDKAMYRNSLFRLAAPGLERESMKYTWSITGRYRDFRMKVYPQVGYGLVMFVLVGYRMVEGLDPEEIREMSEKLRFPVLIIIYFSWMIFYTALFQLPYYQKHNAAWIFFITPLEKPGKVLSGAIKACLVKFWFPAVACITLATIAFLGWHTLPNLLFGFSNVWLILMMATWFMLDKLPFTMPPSTLERGNFSIKIMWMMILMPAVAIPHYFLWNHPVILLCASVLTLSAGLILLYFFKRITWSDLKMAESTL